MSTFTAYMDGALLFEPGMDDHLILEPTLDYEENTVNAFTFTFYPQHPLYDQIDRLISEVSVYQHDRLIFRGRVYDDEVDMLNGRRVECLGPLAFFNDSFIRPFDYGGGVREFLEWIVQQHNEQVDESKQFTVGQVTVTDPNDYIVRSDINGMSSWECLQSRLIRYLGGYFITRYNANGDIILDYFLDSPYLSDQTIEFGENLLDMEKTIKGSEIKTAIIPYGSRLEDEEGEETDERLTIESVNNGLDYVYQEEAVEKYGWIFMSKVWDDVTLPENLIQRAQAEIATASMLGLTLELNAIDLSMAGIDTDRIRYFDYVRVKSAPHKINDLLLVKQMTIRLDDPLQNTLTLGKRYDNISDQQVDNDRAIEIIRNEREEADRKMKETILNQTIILETTLTQNAQEIVQEAMKNVLTETDLADYEETVSTRFSQTATQFDFEFTTLNTRISTVDEDARKEFEEIKKYIRFVNGEIHLGEEGNEIELEIRNDKIRFLQNGAEVAYFSNNKLYVTDVRVLEQLRIGNFAYLPRSNGSLEFKKVVN